MSNFLTSFFLLIAAFQSVGLATEYKRIVTTSPSLTELVYQIKGQDKLVATTEYSYYPEAAKSLPTIGTFFSPSIETTLLYKPDLVVVDGAARNHAYEEALKSQGISLEVISIHSIDSLYSETEKLQKLFTSHTEFKPIEKPQNTKTYSYVGFVWTSPSIILSKNTFLDSLLEYTGGKNLADFKSEQTYLTVSDEWLMVLRPDVVFMLQEQESQKEEFRSFCKRIWKSYSPKIVFLPYGQFARTTFTAVEGLKVVWDQVHESK